MAYTKTTWNPGAAPGISAENLNKIETGIEAAHKLVETDPRTPDPAQTAQASGTLVQLQNFWANMLKRITGKTNWYDAPDTTLATAKTHIDAAAPHTGHETPAGAQAKVDAHVAASDPHPQYASDTALTDHANLATAHGATPAATASRIVLRDAAGRAKVVAPLAADDIACKDTVDVKFDASAGHKHTGAAGDGPKIPLDSVDMSGSSLIGAIMLFGNTSQTAIANGTISRAYTNLSDVNTWISFGPTGSGCTVILAGMDVVPNDAKAVIFCLKTWGSNTYQRNVRVRKYGDTVYAEAGLSIYDTRYVLTIVKCDPTRKFEFYWEGTNSGSMWISLSIVGYVK